MATTTHDTSRTAHLLALMKNRRPTPAAAMAQIFRTLPDVHADNDPFAAFWDAALQAQQIGLA
jgi:uncharacterized protein with ATP-grasp and redox domains